MPTPAAHALLSASSAHRWLECTAAPLFEAQFPSSSNKYADEGVLAHSVCELKARKYFTVMSGKQFDSELDKLKQNEYWKDEMLRTADVYVQYLKEKAFSYPSTPHITFEIRVDMSDWIPEGFGTCDCVMIGSDTLHITDYKHGQGVPVSPVENPQMCLYALGALKLYRPVFGDRIQKVSMAIVQPRITEDVEEYVMPVQELLDWGTRIKPIAEKAYNGQGEFKPGDHCRFCRGKAVCRARALQNTALEEFKDCVTPKAFDGNPAQQVLSNAEIGDLITRGKFLEDWYADLREYAVQAILNGEKIPGYKLVEGKSNRAFTDVDQAIARMKKEGFKEAILYERKPLSLSKMEELTGKKAFAEIMKGLIVKPMGKPTLVGEDDKRESYSSAKSDFGGIANEN